MSTTGSRTVCVADVVTLLDQRYPPAWAQDWDRVGLVLGEPSTPVRRVACVVDCVPETVDEALAAGADMIVAHHPLLLRGVSSVAPTSYKGRIIHQMIKNDMALYVAHTNADVANPGVSDALAVRLGLTDLRPLHPAPPSSPAHGEGRGLGRIGQLPQPMTLREFTQHACRALPDTSWGVRAAGDDDQMVHTVAVSGGSGESLLRDATTAGVDVFLTADLRHHIASEHVSEGGPALLDAAHWATERPWLDDVAAYLRDRLGVPTLVSNLDTDPWTVHVAPLASPEDTKNKEPLL